MEKLTAYSFSAKIVPISFDHSMLQGRILEKEDVEILIREKS